MSIVQRIKAKTQMNMQCPFCEATIPFNPLNGTQKAECANGHIMIATPSPRKAVKLARETRQRPSVNPW